MSDKNDFQIKMGVSPTVHSALDPRQKRFIDLYLDVNSASFGNCYRSAISAGFSDQTARNLTHNKPRWYSEIIGQNEGVQPEHLLLKLTDIINSPNETTHNKLKAIDMLMRQKGMYRSDVITASFNQINIQNVLD